MLTDLGFSANLEQHLENPALTSPLFYRCQPARHYKLSAIVERNIVPLWECGAVLTYFNRDSCFFEQCSLEAIDDVFFRFNSVQAVLADLFLDLYEDEVDADELTRMASFIGFRHIGRLISEAEKNRGVDYVHWRNAFPGTCQN
jgi:hypothetical protein